MLSLMSLLHGGRRARRRGGLRHDQRSCLLLIGGLALLIFGPKKLPELGKGIREGIRGFKAAMSPDVKPAEVVKEVDANRPA
jgi:sec-independent protein translocase protein TatA